MLNENFASKLSQISQIFIYHSRGDETVSVDHLEAYAQQLPAAKLRVLNGNEHQFNGGLSQMVEDIRQL